MKIDLVGPKERGLAMGLNEAAGYGALAITAMVTGTLAAHYGLRPATFLLAASYISRSAWGSPPSGSKETHHHARHEAANHVAVNAEHHGSLGTRQIFGLVSWRERALTSASQAGLVTTSMTDWHGDSSAPVRNGRSFADANRCACGDLSCGLVSVPTTERAAVGPPRAQAVHCRRDATSRVGFGDCRDRTDLRDSGPGTRPALGAHRHGVPHVARVDRRCRPPHRAGASRWRIPALARWRFRGRGRTGRIRRRNPGGPMGCRCAHTVSGLVVWVRMYETHRPIA